MTRLLPIVSLLIVSILLMLPLWVLADTYDYRVPITIFNNGSAVQGPVGIVVTINNAQLAELGYINAAGLDTNLVEGATEQTYGAVEEYVGVFINSIAAYQANAYQYQLGNSPAQTGFPIIVGPEGNITISDDASMELGNNFTVSISGYVDPADDASHKHLISKHDAFETYISADGNITANIFAGATSSSYSSTSDGSINNTGPIYATIRNAGVGTVYDSGAVMNIGQWYSAPNYQIARSLLFFDTSGIPDDAVMESGVLRVSGHTDATTVDFDIIIQNGQPTYPHDPLITADYQTNVRYSGNGGSRNTAGFNTSGYNNLTLNADGLSWINVEGTTKLMLRSSLDIAASAPASGNPQEVWIYTSEEAGTGRDPQLVINYFYSALDVTAEGVTAGLHTVNITADTTDLKIYVDGSEEDSAALGGVSVIDNAETWHLDEENALPYVISYKHEVAGTEVVWFEPVVMPSSANLPDRTGSGNTGTMNFGNPSWAEITVGGVVPFSSYVAGGGVAADPPEVLTPPIDLKLHEDPGATGVGLPLYESMSVAADSLGWSVPVLYVILILIICIALGFAAYVATGSVLGFAALFGMTAAAAGGVQDATGAHIFPWWIALVCVMMAVMLGYTWRHT